MKKETTIQIRLTVKEKVEIERLARTMDKTVSELVRDCALGLAKKVKE
jgi:uncharacterized protein (DUF1778 family)